MHPALYSCKCLYIFFFLIVGYLRTRYYLLIIDFFPMLKRMLEVPPRMYLLNEHIIQYCSFLSIADPLINFKLWLKLVFNTNPYQPVLLGLIRITIC